MTESTKPRVLIADDEEVIANTLTTILNRSGFEARAVYSGESALEAAESFQPDLLITDVVMGGITGVDTAIQFREKYPQCKILLFSGQSATADLLEEAQKNGHRFDVLSKPVHPMDLLAKIRDIPETTKAS
jgi:DNA-binding response OmpR family regulator